MSIFAIARRHGADRVVVSASVYGIVKLIKIFGVMVDGG